MAPAELITLVLGGGVGVTAVSLFVWIGKRIQRTEDREKELAQLGTELKARATIDELVRQHDRDLRAMADAASATAQARIQERALAEERARADERTKAQIKALVVEQRRIGRFFSQQFPRTASQPDIEVGNEKDDENG